MEDPTTIALNLTFFGTLAVAFVMFLGLFIVFVLTLVFAGLGRGAAAAAMALAAFLGADRSRAGTPAVTAPRPARKEGAQLSGEWADAVARADARAVLRSKTQAPSGQGTPERKAG